MLLVLWGAILPLLLRLSMSRIVMVCLRLGLWRVSRTSLLLGLCDRGLSVRYARLGRVDLSYRQLDMDEVKFGFTPDEVKTRTWELGCSFSVSPHCQKAGVIIGGSTDSSKRTTLTFTPQSSTFTITRPSPLSPNSSNQINSAPEQAPHTLFMSRDPRTGDETIEPLRIRAWRGNSVLEVFVSERTVISTRIYAGEGSGGIRSFC
ncbi:uncharacterized protein BDV17DRAFT_197025 [Aspergillus undulatus]|uniref:uncharacterized protein n=1 Tax=Aspergillus undulatus TaxID=1810928 RepID=UPI003CCD960F